MSNRGDVRLLAVITCTASLTAIATVSFVKITDPRMTSLEERVSTLETPSRSAPAPAPPPAPPPVHDAVPDPVPCDEVACVLDAYEPVCCAAFRKVTDALDRGAIRTGIGRVRGAVMSCNDMNATGRVKVSVKVLPDGTVGSVTVREAPNTALAACVSNEMQRAKFAATLYGGSFTYPFMF